LTPVDTGRLGLPTALLPRIGPLLRTGRPRALGATAPDVPRQTHQRSLLVDQGLADRPVVPRRLPFLPHHLSIGVGILREHFPDELCLPLIPPRSCRHGCISGWKIVSFTSRSISRESIQDTPMTRNKRRSLIAIRRGQCLRAPGLLSSCAPAAPSMTGSTLQERLLAVVE